ncbi:hypothetical protein [Thermaerobacillus caldiproteolyticus]|uniref:Uncharacterized protein n=1 Tax=Thermaerobacillus caldiproteolyticus TaxID=247480 RepID=A0A7V9Z7E2_9BACL|nr:hypothetical protein [Anoxybacillus caldiproteolyticus]MBA2875404.1 hypothetical protein [Anoxybacillus caldiproteolyticus]QPA32697.1 hypothetical protein ISX45_07190 [Anoxybacillus caldiproteolyticus]
MGKKHRNRINGQKKNNHIPKEALIAEDAAHAKEYSATGRKNGPGHHDNPDS